MNTEFGFNELPDLFELHVFAALYDCRTVKSASNRLSRSPSSVSTRLKHLEAKLERRLFHRTGRVLQPTSHAEILIRYSRKIFEDLNAATSELRNATEKRFVIGSMDSTAMARLPPVLQQYRSRYPTTRLTLKTGTSSAVASMVFQGEADVAFVADAHRPFAIGLWSEPVFREELVIVASPSHRQILGGKDVRGESLLAFGEGCVYRERLFEWFEASSEEPREVLDMWSYSAILASVVEGIGVAMLPRSTIDKSELRRQVSVHSLASRFADSTTSMVWLKNRKRTAPIEVLLGIIRHGRSY